LAEQEINWIVLVDEDGHEHRFNLLDIVEVEGGKYAVMVPEIQNTANDEEEEEAVIFRIETDENGEEVLVDIEDDDEFIKVREVLDEMYEEDDDELPEDDENEEKN
jgi:uncharacterized protein YrzB (UPF0473 family)